MSGGDPTFSGLVTELRRPDPEGAAARCGPLTLWMKVSGGEWLCRTERRGAEADPADPAGETSTDEGWRRVGAFPEHRDFEIRPAFPDRPMVVRPEFPYVIQPGERVHFYVSVPVTLQLLGGGVVLLEEPVVRLSNTWFGTPLEGELCYAMRTLARRELDEVEVLPWRVICPVRIRNQSRDRAGFERLCLRVPFLSIFEHPTRGLWANESSVIIRDQESWTRVAYGRGAPAQAAGARLLASSRREPRGTFSLRTLTRGKGFFQ